MENLGLFKDIVYIGVGLFGIVSASVSFIIAKKKKVAVKKGDKEAVDKCEKQLKLLDVVVAGMEAVEKMTMPSEAKKEFAISKIARQCVKYGIEASDDDIDTMIEKVIDASKNINQRQKDKDANFPTAEE